MGRGFNTTSQPGGMELWFSRKTSRRRLRMRLRITALPIALGVVIPKRVRGKPFER